MSEKVVVPMVQYSLSGRDLAWTVVLAAPFLATHLLTPMKLDWFLLSVVCAAPLLVALLMLLQWHAKRLPEAYCSSLAVEESGFVFSRPFGRTVVIAFAEVRRVVASSLLDGEYGEPTTTLTVYSSQRKVSVGGELLYLSSLLDRIQQLPGFDQDAYARHNAEEGSFLRCVVPKRTELLSRHK